LPAKEAHPECRFLGASFVVTARRTQPELHDGSPRNARNGLGAGRVALQPVFGRALLLPVAMLGATARIVLGLLGAGQLWMSAGLALLAVGPVDLVNQHPLEALVTDGRRAVVHAIHPIVRTAASAVATVLFAIA